MTNAIIGASGDVGKNLLLPLLKQLGPVYTAGRESSDEDWQNVWQTDVIWLSVPRDAIPGILKNVRLRPDQLVIDICSIKRRLSEVITKTGAAHLSLHPLNGPMVPINGQKWVIVSTDDNKIINHSQADKILAFLKDQGVSFLQAGSQDQHDFMIGITLSMPEIFTIFIDFLIDQYSKNTNQPRPSMETIMEWAVPASNALFSAYVHSINSSADWLRKDLICGAHNNLLDSAKKAAEQFSQIPANQVEQIVKKQRDTVASLSLEERKRVKQWIERWFVDSTQKVFAFHKKIQMKPKLNIQECEDAKDIFPVDKGRVTVGVHGIEGCFTHESIYRLAEDLSVDPKKLDFKYLVESRRVMEAVTNGEVDRGVFAFANSGSGAYVSSMHAVGDFDFEVLAIYGMEILQCLITHPDIKNISEITEVFGHPQAVSQCKRTFAEKYPEIKLTIGKDSDDTALCAQWIAQGKLPKTTATLASQIAAKKYGLNILEYGMHHDPFNTTSFLVIKKKG